MPTRLGCCDAPQKAGSRNKLAFHCFLSMDLFRNYEKVDKVECPVLVMHGTDDDIVPIESGMAIQEACRKAVEPLWLEGYGHNDLPNEICLRRVREFMDQMDGLSWGWNIFVTNLATHISVNL
ncbi:Alpha/beta hydrolase domain-containing protein 17A [Symbiodinium microadriaticum]|uniref:Alpha/beta hydrolase domain-containing protein 17A n=1 Tax=Symbiodinium microadriaticum TaxID=2951 RepID=A0A1Q9EAN6_SYMMI|nr:Alpha/beta hydrolase domain-containing protein 17A [Symbiodinium microadriaticum]